MGVLNDYLIEFFLEPEGCDEDRHFGGDVDLDRVREFDITGAFSRYLCSNGDLDEDGNS